MPSFAIGLIALGMQLSFPLFYKQSIDSIDSFFIYLLISQFVHLSWVHLSLNLAGLAIIVWGFGHLVKTTQMWCIQTASFLFIAFYLSEIELLSWYCGLSGALHFQFTVFLGLACTTNKLPLRKSWPLGILLIGLFSKLIFEAIGGGSYDPLIGGRIAIEAHRGGVLGGIIFGLIDYTLKLKSKYSQG